MKQPIAEIHVEKVSNGYIVRENLNAYLHRHPGETPSHKSIKVFESLDTFKNYLDEEFKNKYKMDLEDKINQKLLMRGFTEKALLNNRGIIGATIDETVLILSKALINDNQ